jgi:hypothetical protein
MITPLYTVDIPPAIYDHPFPGKVVVHNHLLSEIPKYWASWQIACAPIGVRRRGTCEIHILTPGQDDGWPGDHRGARGMSYGRKLVTA